ncbi:MAG: hypothetical protein IJ620_05395 [Bacteroidales bacterium]|nr:hypothetical protein [Bacteroidales bacterium]
MTRPGLEHYDVKILLALLKSIEGRKDFFRWLMENGYPELGAFSNAICGDVEALQWLFGHKYEWLGIIVNAIDGMEQANAWLAKGCQPVNLMMAMASRRDATAIAWLEERKLGIFLMLADAIHEVSEVLDAERGGPYVRH